MQVWHLAFLINCSMGISFPHLNLVMNDLIEFYFKSPYIMVIRYRIHRQEIATNELVITDLMIQSKKPVFYYEYLNLTGGINNGLLSYTRFLPNTDILLLVDQFKTTQRFPPIQKYPNTTLIMIIAKQPRKFFVNLNPSAFMLVNSPDELRGYRTSVVNNCGKIGIVQRFLWFYNSGGQMEMKMNTNVFPKYESSCFIDIEFILNHMATNIENQVEYIKNHYVFEVFKILGKHLNVKVRIGSQSNSHSNYYIDENNSIKKISINELSYVFTFYFEHFMVGENPMSYLPSSLMAFLTTEEIVWLVIDPSPRKMNNEIFIWFIVFIIDSILLSFLLEVFLRKCNSKQFRSLGEIQKLLFYAISIHLNVSVPRQPRRDVSRIFFQFWVLSSAVLTMSFYYSIYSALTVPVDNRLNSQEELIESKITLLTYSENYADMAFSASPYNKSLNQLHPKYEAYLPRLFQTFNRNTTFSEFVREKVRDNKPLAVLTDFQLSKYILQSIPTNTNIKYYYIPRPVAFYSVFLYSVKTVSLLNDLIKKLSWLKNAGLIDHLITKMFPDKFSAYSYTRTNIEYFSNVYILMFLLYGLCIVVFICEIIYFYLSKAIKRRRYLNSIMNIK